MGQPLRHAMVRFATGKVRLGVAWLATASFRLRASVFRLRFASLWPPKIIFRPPITPAEGRIALAGGRIVLAEGPIAPAGGPIALARGRIAPLCGDTACVRFESAAQFRACLHQNRRRSPPVRSRTRVGHSQRTICLLFPPPPSPIRPRRTGPNTQPQPAPEITSATGSLAGYTRHRMPCAWKLPVGFPPLLLEMHLRVVPWRGGGAARVDRHMRHSDQATRSWGISLYPVITRALDHPHRVRSAFGTCLVVLLCFLVYRFIQARWNGLQGTTACKELQIGALSLQVRRDHVLRAYDCGMKTRQTADSLPSAGRRPAASNNPTIARYEWKQAQPERDARRR